MRLSLRFLLMLIPAMGLLVLGFFAAMDRLERKWVLNEMSHRARLLSDSLQEPIVSSLDTNHPEALSRLATRLSRESRLTGLSVCSDKGTLLGRSVGFPKYIDCKELKARASRESRFVTLEGEVLHEAAYPIFDDSEHVRGYLIILQDPAREFSRHGLVTRKYAVFAFLVLVVLIAFVTVLVHRWSVSQPMEQASLALRALLKGDLNRFRRLFENTELAPMVKDLEKVLRGIRGAKSGQSEVPSNLWTPTRLREEVRRLFGDARLCVVANREPYIHNRKGKSIEVQFPASGLVTAVEPIVRATSGLWIGHGSGTADRETADKNGVVLVPPGRPEYALKRVWLTKEEEEGYYYGFSNEGIWPLCHIAHTRPIFRKEDWESYRTVNAKFADAFAKEMKEPGPVALIQDYHFALLPGILRKQRPDAITSLFWHIPWPNPEAIRICPWKTELLSGMLGADLIGFHIQHHCNNFLDTVDSMLEARVDREKFSVTVRGHTCYVRPFPISVDWPPKDEVPATEVPKIRAHLVEELGISTDAVIGLGVDRLDYTKGIVERLQAVERMLELHPELVGKFVFIQIAAPSRVHIPRYQQLDFEVRELAARINFRFRRPDYEPVLLRISHHSSSEVFRYYRAANVVVVSALHDGMNLVAKEYIASRSDGDGALVLSSFTGAAREIHDALVVNPYDIEETAEAIYKGLSMDESERRQRMARMRNWVASNNVYAWAAQFLGEIRKIAEWRETPEKGALRAEPTLEPSGGNAFAPPARHWAERETPSQL